MDRAALRQRLLATACQEGCYEGFGRRLAVFLDLEPLRVEALLAVLEAPGRSPWVETRPNHYTLGIQGGSRRAAARCRLIQTPAESALPRSIAPGWVFVLAGVAETGWGACWLPGDLYRLEKSQTPLWSLGPHPLLLASVSRRSTSESD